MADTEYSKLTLRQQHLRQWEALKQLREPWLADWRDIDEYVRPRRSQFLYESMPGEAGTKRASRIINNTPLRASRILPAGMMAGMTSPSRPWFRLTTPDPELAEHSEVRPWLHDVEERIRAVFNRCNIYNALHLAYTDLATFGVTAMHLDEDSEDIMRAYVFPIGSYALANSARLAVDSLYRVVPMQVRQMVERFTLEKCSDPVRDAYNRGQYTEWRDVLHVMVPNKDKQAHKSGYAGMAYCSDWLELVAPDDTQLLGKGGYEERPFLAPRWSVAGVDVYGDSPGKEALGDCKAIQQLERRKLQLVDKMTDPPMRAPSGLATKRANLLPGEVTYVDSLSPSQTLAPALEIPPMAVQVVGAEVAAHARRINEAFFADLWLALLDSDMGRMTATEVQQRQEEKMLQLGPTTERLQDELLDPLIDRTFSILVRGGYIPPAPPELQGMPLRVEFTSIMAQAQKAVGISSVRELAAFTGNLSAAFPSVRDKLNSDKVLDEYAKALGVKPDLLRTDDEVAGIRKQQAQAAAAQAQAAQAQATVEGAKVLSETDTSTDNALTRILGARA